MKKSILLLSIIFATMSSFKSPFINCDQNCANSATLNATIFGWTFDQEADYFFACVDAYCNNS